MSLTNKTLNTRIKLKYDSLGNWESNNPVLLKGEIALVTVATGGEYTNPVTGEKVPVVELLMKAGDGELSFKSLPWLSAKASDVYGWAKETQPEFETRVSTLITNALKGDGVSITGYVTESEFNAFKTELETWKSDITNDEKTGRLDVAEKNIKALQGKDTDDKDSVSIVGAKKYADDKDTKLLGEATDNAAYAEGTEGASLDKQTIKGAINIADAALTKAKSNATEINTLKTTVSKLDETYATDTQLEGVRSDLQGKVDSKVAQSAYDVKVKALEDADTALAAKVTPLETDVSALKSASATHATKKELEEAEKRLKGTKASGDTTAETIAGAKKYADQKLLDFENAYIKADGGAINTLNEIAAWIADDKAGAAKLVDDVAALQSDKLDITDFDEFKSNDFDAVVDDAAHTNREELNKIATGDKDKWDKAVGDLDDHTKDTAVHIAKGEREKWNDVSNKADQTALDAHTTATGNVHGLKASDINVYTTTEANDKFAALTAFESDKTTVKKATHAESADTATTATKATQDSAGNDIAATYETKANVSELATRVKALEDIDFITIDCGSSVITSN